LKYLIDTNIFLFALEDPTRISKKALRILEEPSNDLFLSHASLWEISIKHSIGKLKFQRGLEKTIDIGMERLGLQIIPIRSSHIYKVSDLQFHHNDPFDRLIISQCLVEKLPILSSDKIFSKYKVSGIFG
jgi:PIN domain nuclease of toxin-antitoxin system